MWTDEHYIFVKNSEMYQILTEAQLEGSVMLLTISRSKHLLNFLSKKKWACFCRHIQFSRQFQTPSANSHKSFKGYSVFDFAHSGKFELTFVLPAQTVI